MARKFTDFDEMIDLGLEEYETGEVSQKAPARHRVYVLLYMPQTDRIVMGKPTNTMPCLFGGGKETAGHEKDEDTARRELLEETGGA